MSGKFTLQQPHAVMFTPYSEYDTKHDSAAEKQQIALLASYSGEIWNQLSLITVIRNQSVWSKLTLIEIYVHNVISD